MLHSIDRYSTPHEFDARFVVVERLSENGVRLTPHPDFIDESGRNTLPESTEARARILTLPKGALPGVGRE